MAALHFFHGPKLVKDLTMTGTVISETWSAAGIASSASSAINCKNYVNVTGINFVGGICGTSRGGVISNCENYGTITMTSMGWSYGGCGGIVGELYGSIENCRNYGEIIKAEGYYNNHVTTYVFGGITGWLDSAASVSDCLNVVNLEYGGIVGQCMGNEESYILNCYNTGNCGGGMVANAYSCNVSMMNCYNIGNCKAGIVEKTTGTNSIRIVNTYNTEKCDCGVVVDGITALTEEEMKNQKTVLETGKTFVEILNENIGENEWKHWTVGANGYPVFVNE